MFSRFKALEKFSEDDQKQLKESKVAIVGLGATGSVMAEHLARHGAKLLLIDRDYLEPNDVYSSSIYKPEQCEKAIPKAIAAEQQLENFTNIDSRVESLNSENIDILEDIDLILDGTDNLDTRFLISEYSKKEDIPWVYTAAIGEEGYSMFFDNKCFNCVFEKVGAGSLETCETAGILREISTIAASMSAEKAVKYLTGKEVKENLETVSGESFEVENNGCEVCEESSYPHLESDRSTAAVCGENKYQLNRQVGEKAMKRLRESGDVIADNNYLLRVSINDREITAFYSGRIILQAQDKGHAENVVSEILGV
jgi:molybdopterin/thiamine biosynthesis adenylyltransferase